MFEDKALQCVDCHQEFIFTSGEQEFYDRKGFKEIPKRCKECRDLRKRRGDGDSGDAGIRQARGGSARELHDAVCASCGSATRVPFRPSSDRPVYCRDCFAKVQGSR